MTTARSARPTDQPQRLTRTDARAKPQKGNQILARTMYNEFTKLGRSHLEIIEFVNELLSLVARLPGDRAGPLIDPATGLPTREAFIQLLLAELRPDRDPDEASTLLVLECDEAPQIAWHRLAQRHLRPTDVVVAIEATRLAAVVRCPESAASLAAVRVCTAIQSRLEGALKCSLTALQPGASFRATWKRACHTRPVLTISR